MAKLLPATWKAEIKESEEYYSVVLHNSLLTFTVRSALQRLKSSHSTFPNQLE